MAQTNESPYKDEGLKAITKQIEDLLDDVVTEERRAELRKQPPRLDGNPFSVWVLGTDGLVSTQKDKDLRDLAKDTKRWHHQIKLGANLAYARSAIPDNKSRHASLTKLSVSALAKNVDEALKWFEKNVRNETWVRLLTVPAYDVNALWWIDQAGNSQVLVLPDRFSNLKSLQRLSSQAFLKFLLAKPRVGGIKRKHD
jgi:hypothetical protein